MQLHRLETGSPVHSGQKEIKSRRTAKLDCFILRLLASDNFMELLWLLQILQKVSLTGVEKSLKGMNYGAETDYCFNF